MDKNSIIGIILIAAIMFGFTFVQSRQYEKRAEIQRQLDSAYAAEHPELAVLDSARLAAAAEAAQSVSAEPAAPVRGIYKDSLLNVALEGVERFAALENDNIRVEFTSKGAQPYSAQVKGYYNYGGTPLYLFNAGGSKMAVHVYTGEYINTADLVFDIVESSDSSLVMRLPVGDGYIEQSYTLPADSYMITNRLSFIGMDGVIPRNVSSVDIDYDMVIPRMEKGYKNELQYSKLSYYFDGDKKPVDMGRGRNASKRTDSKLSWFAFQQQFFSAIFRSKQEFASGELSVKFAGQDDLDHNLMTCSAKMREELVRGADGNAVMEFEMYMGPNHYKTLKSYDQKYEKVIPLGGWLVGWFTRFVIIPMFDLLHKFISNFGLIILLMTIVIKLVVLPFTYKSYASSAKMQALKPELDKINARYPKQEDALKKQQATMDLYKRAGANPMGGCLPMLLTFPILWAMFRFFPASIELRQQSFLWCDDLSSYDAIVEFGHRIPLLGDHLSLFALIMAATMFFYSKITTAGQAYDKNDPNAASMRFMSQWMMPIMMFFICNSLSAALSYYYILSNLITMLETFIIRKFVVKPEAVLAKVRASEGKPLPKSKWQQRLEEAQKMQQAQLREQQKKNRR